MLKKIFHAAALILLAGILLAGRTNQSLGAPGQQESTPEPTPQSAQAETPAPEAPEPALAAAEETFWAQQSVLPVFRYPVVPGAVISGYFDHQAAGGIVHHYNGRQNAPGAGYYFECPQVYMDDWVGCQDMVAGEPGCANHREVWYDNHHGTDYEFASNWHTGAVCDPGRFAGITKPIYAPAAGQVFFAGTDPNRWANGWHIRMKHDLNRNGNYDDDMFRSVYLHFTANQLNVYAGQIIQEGHYLGLGGSTGYSSSPHLHFEVQRSTNYFQTYWSADPFGWEGPGADPWGYQNVLLFRLPPPVQYKYKFYLPHTTSAEMVCPECGWLLRNTGFEEDEAYWTATGTDIIVDTSYPTLRINPHSGNFLAWLGGRDNAPNDSVSQTFTVPHDASNATLTYHLYLTTEETGGAADYFIVRLRDSNGNVLREFDYLNNTFADRNRWVTREFNLSLEAWRGWVLTLQVKGMTDGSAKSSFYVDDISLNMTD